MQAVDEIADMVGDIAHVQPFPAAVARVEDLLEILAGADYDLVVRERAVAQVVDRAELGVGLHDPLGQFGKLFFTAKIRSHDKVPNAQSRR